MNLSFTFDAPIFFWRGPAPWYFVAIPADQSDDIKAVANQLTYGWGVIPVTAQVGNTRWTTSLIPKDGLYLVPIRADIRKAEQLADGDTITVHVEMGEFRL